MGKSNSKRSRGESGRDSSSRQKSGDLSDTTEHDFGVSAAEIVGSSTAAANAAILRRTILNRPTSVFYYPASRYDFAVLRWFDTLCSTFIFCDHLASLEEFEARLHGMEQDWRVGNVQVVDVNNLHLDPAQSGNLERFVQENLRSLYETVIDDWSRNRAWGRCVNLSRRSGGEHKRIKLYYFCAEEFTAYVNLFTNANAAPKIVCLKNTGGFDGYLDLNTWEAPLGRAVAESPQPELIVVATDEHGSRANANDWPWQKLWRRFPALLAAAYMRQHPVS